jgi:hypothetical protein
MAYPEGRDALDVAAYGSRRVGGGELPREVKALGPLD